MHCGHRCITPASIISVGPQRKLQSTDQQDITWHLTYAECECKIIGANQQKLYSCIRIWNEKKMAKKLYRDWFVHWVSFKWAANQFLPELPILCISFEFPMALLYFLWIVIATNGCTLLFFFLLFCCVLYSSACYLYTIHFICILCSSCAFRCACVCVCVYSKRLISGDVYLVKFHCECN